MNQADEMNKSVIESMIPFDNNGFRPGQWEAIQQIIEAINNGDKYIILNAPVGVGKSLIGYIVARILQLHDAETYLYTKTKQLQDQYLEDFPDVKLVKGRANFTCRQEELFDCRNGMCQTHNNYLCELKPILKDKWYYDGEQIPDMLFDKKNQEKFDWFTSGMCEYWKQKVAGILSPITMLNYNYAISDARFVNHFPYRELLICDEGHNIEQLLMNELETSFSPSAVEKETQFKITPHVSIQQWIDDIEVLIEIYENLINNTKSDMKQQKYQERLILFKSLNELLIDNPSNWVLTQETHRGHLYYIFKPIKVNEYTHLLFNIARHVVIMSGTILKPDIFARDLGINDYTYIEIPSIVPIKNRPIIKSYVGSMARSSIDVTMPNMIRRIQMLAEKHQDEKGVIHTFTYNIANRLKMGLKSDNRFIFHNQNDKERRFKEFKKNKTNKILVSPVAFEGVDFPYDEARWQCICKDPFPNIGDPQLKVRDMTDYGWLFRQRCLVLSQMYGRTNRAADDYSVTYLLDSRIDSLLGPATLVTDYFLEALDGFNYNKKFILSDDAYDRLTPDNKRKNHDVDRFEELAMLDAITDEGLDTMNKLRRAYKEIPNDSYTLVIPAIQRLVKNGAIRYE